MRARSLRPVLLAALLAGGAGLGTLSETAAASPLRPPPAGSLLPSDITGLYPAAHPQPVRRDDNRIAVIGVADADLTASVTAYRRATRLPDCGTCFATVAAPPSAVAPGNPLLDATDDAQLALPSLFATEAAVASCPSCRITYVTAATSNPNDVGMAAAVAIRVLRARLIVVPFAQDVRQASDRGLFRQFYDVRGLTLLVAGPDEGASRQLGMPANAPTALAVGGTTVTRTATGWSSASWLRTTSDCSTQFPRPSWQQRLSTSCRGRASVDLAAAANPSTTPFAAVIATGPTTTWASAGGTAVAAGLLAGWTVRSHLAGILTPSWLYAHPELLADVSTGYGNRCTLETDPCGEKPGASQNCDERYPRLCTPLPGWDGMTGLGTPQPARVSR
jgi:hypothetical protein